VYSSDPPDSEDRAGLVLYSPRPVRSKGSWVHAPPRDELATFGALALAEEGLFSTSAAAAAGVHHTVCRTIARPGASFSWPMCAAESHAGLEEGRSLSCRQERAGDGDATRLLPERSRRESHDCGTTSWRSTAPWRSGCRSSPPGVALARTCASAGQGVDRVRRRGGRTATRPGFATNADAGQACGRQAGNSPASGTRTSATSSASDTEGQLPGLRETKMAVPGTTRPRSGLHPPQMRRLRSGQIGSTRSITSSPAPTRSRTR